MTHGSWPMPGQPVSPYGFASLKSEPCTPSLLKGLDKLSPNGMQDIQRRKPPADSQVNNADGMMRRPLQLTVPYSHG